MELIKCCENPIGFKFDANNYIFLNFHGKVNLFFIDIGTQKRELLQLHSET